MLHSPYFWFQIISLEKCLGLELEIQCFKESVLIITHLKRPIDGISWRAFEDVWVVAIKVLCLRPDFHSRTLKPLFRCLTCFLSYHRNDRGWNYCQHFWSEPHLLVAEQITQVCLSNDEFKVTAQSTVQNQSWENGQNHLLNILFSSRFELGRHLCWWWKTIAHSDSIDYHWSRWCWIHMGRIPTIQIRYGERMDNKYWWQHQIDTDKRRKSYNCQRRISSRRKLYLGAISYALGWWRQRWIRAYSWW